jgi:hypothetical protein
MGAKFFAQLIMKSTRAIPNVVKAQLFGDTSTSTADAFENAPIEGSSFDAHLELCFSY